MGLSCQLLVFFIYQITKTLSLATDFSSSPTLSPHRAEHQNLRMSVTIDPGVGLTSPLPSSITIAPLLSVEATPRFASGSPNSLPTSVSPGFVNDNSPTILPVMQNSKDTSLDTLAPIFDQTSLFFDGIPTSTLPGIVNDNTPIFLPITYPGETLKTLTPSLDSVSPFYDSLSPISSYVIDNNLTILPLKAVPIETPRPVLAPTSISDNNPSGIQLSGITVPIIDNSQVLSLSSVQLTESNGPLIDSRPSESSSDLHLTRENLALINNNLSGSQFTGITVPIIDNNPFISPSSIHLTEKNLPFIDNSPSVSPLGLQLEEITVPIIDTNPQVSPTGEHFTGINVPLVNSGSLISPPDLHLTGITVPIIDNNSLVSPPNIHLTGKNSELIENNPQGLQSAGITVPTIDTNPLVSPLSVKYTRLNVPLIDNSRSMSPSGLHLAGIAVPIIDDNPLISPLNKHLTEINVPITDNRPSESTSGLQLLGINLPTVYNTPIVVSPSSVVTPLFITDPSITSLDSQLSTNNNPTAGPPSLKMAEIPITEAIPNVPISRPIIDPLPHITPYISEAPHIGSHVNIPPPVLDINFQIGQLNVPPTLENKLPPLQYNCNINDLIFTNNLPPLSSINSFLDQFHHVNQQILHPNLDPNTNNFITVPNNIPSPSNISPDIIFKESTKTVSPIDELKLDNTANPIPNPVIPLPLLPIKPKAYFILNNNELTTVEQTPYRYSEDISINNTPSVSTNTLENISDLSKNSLQFPVDLTSNIYPPNIPLITATAQNQFPNVVLLNSSPSLELATTYDDVSNYNPINVVEQQFYDTHTSISSDPYIYQNNLETAQYIDSFVGNTLCPEQKQLKNTPISIPSPNKYIFENIFETGKNLDAFVGSPLYPDVLSDSDTEYIKTMDSNKYIRSSLNAISELDPKKIEPVVEAILSLTNTNMLSIPLPFQNILNGNPYSNYILKDETLNNILPPLFVMPSNEISSSIPLKSKNVPDLKTQTLTSPFPRSLSPFNSLPPFKLCTPFIKSPSFLPKPSLSKFTRLSSNAELTFSSLLEKSDSSSTVNVSNTKSIPSITSIIINIIPLEEESKSEIIIII